MPTPRKQHKQFTRKFYFNEGVVELCGFDGKPFMTLNIDALDESTARAMCLQHLATAVCFPATEAIRAGMGELEARRVVLDQYDRVRQGQYKPRRTRSPNGVRKSPPRLKKAAEAAYDAGYRQVMHAGQVYTFQNKGEAYLAFKWLWAQGADRDQITGRMVYLDILRDPLIGAKMQGEDSVARVALGVPGLVRPLPSPS